MRTLISHRIGKIQSFPNKLEQSYLAVRKAFIRQSFSWVSACGFAWRDPIIAVINKQSTEIVLSAFLRMSEQAPSYIFGTLIFAYAVGVLQMSRNFILTAVIVTSAVAYIFAPLSGHISDRIGRRKTYRIGAAATGLFGFLYFAMLNTEIPSLVFIAIVLSSIPIQLQYGPQAALIAEAFHSTRYLWPREA